MYIQRVLLPAFVYLETANFQTFFYLVILPSACHVWPTELENDVLPVVLSAHRDLKTVNFQTLCSGNITHWL